MRTKFIGLDGYREIETVGGLTKKRAKKPAFHKKKIKAQKPTRLEMHYAAKRRQGAEKLSTSAITAAKLHKASKSLRVKQGLSVVLKRKAAIGLAASFVAVLLCAGAVNNSFSAADGSSVNNKVKEKKAHSVQENRISQHFDVEPLAVEGYGLYIDGNLAGVCIEDGALEAALQQKLDDYKAKYDDETTDEFANSVEVVYGSYSGEVVRGADEIVEENAALLSYSLSTDIEYTQSIPYGTVTEYDDSEYTDYSKTKRSGVEGEEKVVYRITFVDGVQTDSELKGVETVKEAVDEIVVKGTKERPAEGYATGSFMWPVPYTSTITSGYGARWGAFHSGIDISDGGVYGQDIVASDGGTVEWAGYDNSGYGNYVIINHNNGYKTLYGHCSTVYVSSGQSVAKGETIAAVGSTGDSTGPHLHFEVRTSDGSRLDPLGFV